VSQYGDLLTKLSSSDFSEAEEKAAGSLSTAIDNGIKLSYCPMLWIGGA
jgi:hypothetical protein